MRYVVAKDCPNHRRRLRRHSRRTWRPTTWSSARNVRMTLSLRNGGHRRPHPSPQRRRRRRPYASLRERLQFWLSAVAFFHQHPRGSASPDSYARGGAQRGGRTRVCDVPRVLRREDEPVRTTWIPCGGGGWGFGRAETPERWRRQKRMRSEG